MVTSIRTWTYHFVLITILTLCDFDRVTDHSEKYSIMHLPDYWLTALFSQHNRSLLSSPLQISTLTHHHCTEFIFCAVESPRTDNGFVSHCICWHVDHNSMYCKINVYTNCLQKCFKSTESILV